MSEKKPIKTVSEIAGRIQFLNQAKEEYERRKDPKSKVEARKLKRALKELYWVLGVKQK